MYEDFAKSRAKVNVDDVLSPTAQEDEDKPKLKATGHVFQVKYKCYKAVKHYMHFLLEY